MKKLSVILLIALLTACAQDNIIENVGDEELVSATIQVQIPADTGGTRATNSAIADGTKATELHYAIYKYVGGTSNEYQLYSYQTATSTSDGLTWTLNLTVLRFTEYKIVFWAQAPTTSDEEDSSAPYSPVFDSTSAYVSIDYSAIKLNDDSYDAFYNTYDIEAGAGTLTADVQLTRPFAQINVGCVGSPDGEWKLALPSQKLGTKFNLLTGKTTEVTSAQTAFSVAADSYMGGKSDFYEDDTNTGGWPFTTDSASEVSNWVMMAYVLPIDDGAKYTINSGSSLTANTTAYSINNLPLAANYRTNIYCSYVTGIMVSIIAINQEVTTDPNSDVNLDETATE